MTDIDKKVADGNDTISMEATEEMQKKSEEIIKKLDKESSTRTFSGLMKKIFFVSCILISCYHLYTATFGPPLTLIHRSIHVAMMLALTFLMYPMTKKSSFTTPSIVDWLLVAASWAAPFYISTGYQGFVERAGNANFMDMCMATLLVLLVLEASRRVNGTENYSVAANPYYDNDRGASILTAIDFAIYPMKNKLLKVGTKEELVFGKMDSPLMEEDDGYTKDKRQIDFLSSPFVGTQWKNLSANLGVTFSLTNYDNGLAKLDDGTRYSTTFFTFNTVWADFTYSNISKVLKSVEFMYQMEVGYNDGIYGGQYSKEIWDIVGNNIQANKMYNQMRATLYFDKDISLGIGFILRNFWEHSNATLGALNPAMLEKFDDKKTVQAFGKLANDTDIKNATHLKEKYI